MSQSIGSAAYLKYALIGAASGLLVGIAAAFQANREFPFADLPSEVFGIAMFGTMAGTISGLMYCRLRTLRQSKLGDYVSWSVAVGSAFATIALPETLKIGNWGEYAFVTFLGLVGGAGIGLFARRLRGHET